MEVPPSEPIKDQIKPPERKISKKIRRIAGRTALITSLLFSGGSVVAGELYAGDPFLVPKLAAGFITDRSCARIDPAVMKNVDSTLHQPDKARLTRIEENIVKDESDATSALRDYHDFIQEQAKKNGFTLIDDVPYQEKLKDAKTPEEISAILKDYFSQFDINFEIPQESGFKDIGIGLQPLNMHQRFLTDDLKMAASNLMDDFFVVPKEVLVTSELKEIKLVNSLQDHRPGLTNVITGEMYLTLSGMSDSGTHELGHLLDFQACGLWGQFRDPVYRQLNPPGFSYGDSSVKIGGPDTVVADKYSSTNVKEDKATVYSGTIGGINEALLKGEYPFLEEKATLLLARLESSVPNITQYLRSISLAKLPRT